MSITYGASIKENVVTGDYGNSWLLVYTLDQDGSIYSVSRPSIVQKTAVGCNAYTFAQLNAYRSGAYSEVMFTSLLKPEVRWIFSKAANATNIPLVLQTLLSGGNPATYMTINVNYSVTLDTAKSSVPGSGSNPYSFMHNNSGSEPHDIPTLGVNGGQVWSAGMFWGQIDAYTNYGGFLNTKTAHSGSGGGSTGDRLLVYVR